MTEDQMQARFKHRRRIALISFYLMSLMLIALTAIGLASPTARGAMDDLRWLITTATGLWSTLILGYYVVASYEQGRG